MTSITAPPVLEEGINVLLVTTLQRKQTVQLQ